MAIKAIRGMKDLMPNETGTWRWIESLLIQIATQCGYQEIRTPILEQTDLFKRSIGEITDIVSKEMYTFSDRNGDSLSLRPEGTASCIRAALEHGLLHNQSQRLWYLGPMFRHERPQRGRYRQFFQFGVEAFGWPGPDIDIEHLLMMSRLWTMLELEKSVKLEINSLGEMNERQIHKNELVHYFKKHAHYLSSEEQERAQLNPLRLLDSKNPELSNLINEAPILLNYLGEASLKTFEQVQTALTEAKIPYTINSKLVRGLDYYSHTVYEWKTDELGAQGTLCGGGRYDNLVSQLGNKTIPAAGFGLGIERLIELVIAKKEQKIYSPDIYIITSGEAAEIKGLILANQIRSESEKLNVVTHCGGGTIKNQFKKADKSGARYAVVIGESEIESGSATIKSLREEKAQESIAFSALSRFFMTIIEKD